MYSHYCAVVNPGDMKLRLTREEIEERMDELAREYYDTHDPEIRKRFLNWLGSFGSGPLKGRFPNQYSTMFIAAWD